MDSSIRKLLWIAGLLLVLFEKGWSAPSTVDEDYANDDYANDEDEESNGEDQFTGPPPQILSKGGTVSVQGNQDIFLPCNVAHVDNVAVMWLKDDQIISVDGSMLKDFDHRVSRLSNNTLSISQAQKSDQGIFECKISSTPTIQIFYKLEVTVPPRIVKMVPAEGEKVIRKGEALTLACEAEGNPTPTVSWTRKDGKHFINGHQTMAGTSLTFENVDRRHSGTYYCSAKNYNGAVSATFVIHVDYAPEIEVAEETVTTGESMEPEITCSVHAHPPATVSWFKNGQKLSNASRLTMSNIGKQYTLRIREMTKEDFGSYTCHAANRIGTEKRIISLTGAPSRPAVKATTEKDEVPKLKWSVQSHIPVKQYQLHYTSVNQEPKSMYATVSSKEGNIFSGMAELSDIVPGDSQVAIRAYNDFGWSGYTNITVTKGVSENMSPHFRPCTTLLAIVAVTSLVNLLV